MIKSPVKPEYEKAQHQRIEQRVGKIYLLWIVGLAFDAVGLKAQSVSVVGVSLVVERPEVLQGLIFVGCLCFYFVMIVELTVGVPPTAFTTFMTRARIHYILRRKYKSTFKYMDARDIERFKMMLRGSLHTAIAINAVRFFLPLVHILIFKYQVVGQAISSLVRAA